MIRKVYLLLPILITAFSITGCLKYNQITTIKTDNSGEMFVHYSMHWSTKNDSLILVRQNAFNRDSIQSNFKCLSNKITNIEVYQDNSDSTMHGKVSFTFTDFDSLKFAPAFKNMTFSISSGEGKTKIFRQSVPAFISGFNLEDSSYNFRFTYYLPGKIIEHNASSLSRNKLVWNLNSQNISTIKELKAVFIPFRLKETPPIIYYLTFLIMVIVLFYLIRKNKK